MSKKARVSSPADEAEQKLWREYGRDRCDDLANSLKNPIAPEQRAHDEPADSTQLPPRPDLELNMKSSLEFELGGYESGL